MRKLVLVVLALVALNPRLMPCEACTLGLPHGVISCSTGLQVHWGRLTMTGIRGRAGLFGVFTKESAVDAALSMTLSNMGPYGSGTPESEMRSMIRTMLSKACG